MKVYVVIMDYEYEGNEIFGIYADADDARSVCALAEDERPGRLPRYYVQEWEVA